MKAPITVFVDSDVVISSLISSIGAAYQLINHPNLKLFISDISTKEQEVVIDRLGLDIKCYKDIIMKRFTIIKLKKSLTEVKKAYSLYVTDINDAHIVAGAVDSGVNFLISYNFFECLGKIRERSKGQLA